MRTRVADLQLSYDELNGALVSAEGPFQGHGRRIAGQAEHDRENSSTASIRSMRRLRASPIPESARAAIPARPKPATRAVRRATRSRALRRRRGQRRSTPAARPSFPSCRRRRRSSARTREADQGELPGFRRRDGPAERPAVRRVGRRLGARCRDVRPASGTARAGRADCARLPHRAHRDAAHGAHPGRSRGGRQAPSRT